MPRGRARLPPNSPRPSRTPRRAAYSAPASWKTKTPFFTWHGQKPHLGGCPASPTQSRLRTDTLPQRAPPCIPLPTGSICLPAPSHEGRGARGVHSCLSCCCPPRPKLGTAHPDSPHCRYQLAPELHCVPRPEQGHSDCAHRSTDCQATPCNTSRAGMKQQHGRDRRMASPCTASHRHLCLAG